MPDWRAGVKPKCRSSTSRLRIFDPESSTAQRFHEIDRAAGYKFEAHRIDHKLHAVGFAFTVIRLKGLGEFKPVLEARTATAINRQAQNRRLALFLGDAAHARGGGLGQAGRGVHRPDVVRTRFSLKRSQAVWI